MNTPKYLTSFNLKVYESPLGPLYLISDGLHLVGLHFQKPDGEFVMQDDAVLKQASSWLDNYFAGVRKELDLPYAFVEGTPFQQEVWEIVAQIPYGETISYGYIAEQIAIKQGKQHMSAQAVGQAVGANPIAIIIPCHRVMGKDGKLTGYGGGIEKKIKLLEQEKISYKY